METSASTGDNVNAAVCKLLDMVMKRMRAYVSNMDQKTPVVPTPTKMAPSDVNLKPKTESKSSPCAC